MRHRFSLHSLSNHNKTHTSPILSPQDGNNNGSLKSTFPDKYTISCLVHWASKILRESGTDSPSLDAEVILSHLLGCKRIDLYIHPDQPVEETVVMHYKESIRRRSQRVPLQYITNHAEFMSLDFYVDERVLIPRPETELLVEAVIKRAQMLTHKNEIVIVDIGVGSGNIAITLAKKIDKARIFAIDISPDTLDVAKMNAQKHHVQEKITFLCGNIYEPLQPCGIKTKAHF